MTYRRHCIPEKTFTSRSSESTDDCLSLIEFGLISLKKGELLSHQTGAREYAIIILEGTCRITGEGFKEINLGQRQSVFSGNATLIYLPCYFEFQITPTTNLEVAWTSAPSSMRISPYVIRPEEIKQVLIGKGCYRREAFLILTDAYPSQHLFIGEAFVPPGNHASYPPHRHDNDDLPREVDMEELYFFRFDSDQGFGIQQIYTEDRSIDFACTVRHNDATLIPSGYHPVTTMPGYGMYYLWIMAGPHHRKFLSVLEPDHAWIVESPSS